MRRSGKKWAGEIVALFSLPKLDYLLIVIVLGVALLGAVAGEKITVNDGFGWDGSYYGNMAKDPFGYNPPYTPPNSYSIQRIIPSLIVHYTLRVLHVSQTTHNIILGFELLNTAFLSVSALLWCLVCKIQGIGSTGKWVGFLGIFGGFALTKWISFYPVLTDVVAFTISFGMLFFYLRKNSIGLLLSTIAGAFTWPTLIFEGVLFLLFMKNDDPKEENESPAPHHLAHWFSLAVSVVILGGLIWSLFYERQNHVFPVSLSQPLLPLSIIVALLFWFFALQPLVNVAQFFNLKYWFHHIQPVIGLSTLLCAVGIIVTQKMIALPFTPSGSTVERLLFDTFYGMIVAPGEFVVSHIFFFGPFALLAIFWWKPITRLTRNLGLGMVLNIILGLFLLATSESRHAITMLPLLALPIAQTADSSGLRSSFIWLFAGLTFLFSRVWLPLNNTPAMARFISSLPASLTAGGSFSDTSVNLFYWASNGKWTSPPMYLVQLIIAVLTGILVYAFVRNRKPSSNV